MDTFCCVLMEVGQAAFRKGARPLAGEGVMSDGRVSSLERKQGRRMAAEENLGILRERRHSGAQQVRCVDAIRLGTASVLW